MRPWYLSSQAHQPKCGIPAAKVSGHFALNEHFKEILPWVWAFSKQKRPNDEYSSKDTSPNVDRQIHIGVFGQRGRRRFFGGGGGLGCGSLVCHFILYNIYWSAIFAKFVIYDFSTFKRKIKAHLIPILSLNTFKRLCDIVKKYPELGSKSIVIYRYNTYYSLIYSKYQLGARNKLGHRQKHSVRVLIVRWASCAIGGIARSRWLVRARRNVSIIRLEGRRCSMSSLQRAWLVLS